MISKEKALYQVKLILDYLPEEEFRLIPQETIDYIEDNFEYDENFTINPNVPLEQQKIDDKAYEMLDQIIKKAEQFQKDNKKDELVSYLEEVKRENQEFDVKVENIRLKNIIETLEKENKKITKAKSLLEEYKEALKKKDIEIESLKKTNEDLYESINNLPRVIKKIFFKDFNEKLLKE